jgi:hypothetical protein
MGGVDIEENNTSEPSQPTSSSEVIDTNAIYQKVAPYLANPDYIKQFLEKVTNKSRTEIIKIIESELENSDTVRCTDLRILLNSI